MGGIVIIDETSPLIPPLETPCTRVWSPTSLATRVTALVLMSLVGFGAFFCFDNPGALQTEVISHTDINILYEYGFITKISQISHVISSITLQL